MAVGHFEDGSRQSGNTGVENIILGDVPFTNQGDRSQQFIVPVASRLQGVPGSLYERLDAYHVVGALIADNLGCGNVHQLDVLGHDDVGGHLAVHVDLLFGGNVSDDTEKTEEK